MIVRILNDKEDTDRFYDCRNSCVHKTNRVGGDEDEFSLIFEFTVGDSIEVVLGKGDKIYYMNDSGKTVHADCKARNIIDDSKS